MIENGNENEQLKQAEFKTNTVILDKLIDAELKKFTEKMMTYSSETIRYSGVKERTEEFILHYAAAKGYKIENKSNGEIYDIKVFVPLPNEQILEINFWADREREQGYINTQFHLKKIKEAKE